MITTFEVVVALAMILFALSVFGYSVVKGNFFTDDAHRPLKYVYDDEETNEQNN